jgi:hypothetical protein
MVCRILKLYGDDKADALLEDFSASALAFDPARASYAEVTFMQAELKTLIGRLVKIEAEVRQEHTETEDLQQTYHRYLYAARVLQQELDQISGLDRRADIELSLAKLVDLLERLQPELAQELVDDRALALWTSRLRATVETLSKRLEDARGDLLSAQSRTERGQTGKQSEAATMLTTALTSISVALDKMNRDAVQTRAEKEALETKLDKLRGNRLEHDPHIAAALGTRPSRTGSALVHGASLRERLARLENPLSVAPASAA